MAKTNNCGPVPCSVTNPCRCINATSTSTPTTSQPCITGEECCLKACNAIIYCENAVGPCGQAGVFDLTTLEHDTSGCTGSVQYVLESFTAPLVDARITSAGSLTWVTGGADTVGEYATVNFRITCQSDCDDCITLNSVGYIEVGTKDLCANVVCDDECEACDPCTGTCIEVETDISIESGS